MGINPGFWVGKVDNSGILRLEGLISDFSIWDDTIHLYVIRFHAQFNVYPNIILASDHTYKKIDLYAQKHPERLIDPDGEETIETSTHPYQGISHFSTDEYSLECCLDNDLAEGAFTLIFDETPDFDGEPIEEDEKMEDVYFYARSA